MRPSVLLGSLLLVLGIVASAFAADRYATAQTCRDAGGVAPSPQPVPSASCESTRYWMVAGLIGLVLALGGGTLILLGMRGAWPRSGRPS